MKIKDWLVGVGPAELEKYNPAEHPGDKEKIFGTLPEELQRLFCVRCRMIDEYNSEFAEARKKVEKAKAETEDGVGIGDLISTLQSELNEKGAKLKELDAVFWGAVKLEFDLCNAPNNSTTHIRNGFTVTLSQDEEDDDEEAVARAIMGLIFSRRR